MSFGKAPAAHVSCGPSLCSSASPAGTGTVHVTVSTAGATGATGPADAFTYASAGDHRPGTQLATK
ncbi:hypothetical protein [Streptomyces sp. MST-110588]|uniref:hypothetical protein n=1 Tax=Streptomyces sp. MST-110588 TaxID=2833628 RepID=UPI001F5D0832|nr:hypothetical protein [Streptomyces sp. MST-110588]UNO39094.1 hypothetical protein KGS77_04930 [Streptomyces sp. MST-110588]